MVALRGHPRLQVQLLRLQVLPHRNTFFKLQFYRLKTVFANSRTALPNFLAKVGLGIFAEFAFTTLRHIQRDDGVTLVKKNRE